MNNYNKTKQDTLENFRFVETQNSNFIYNWHSSLTVETGQYKDTRDVRYQSISFPQAVKSWVIIKYMMLFNRDDIYEKNL